MLRKININIEKADISAEIFKIITKYKKFFDENFDINKFIANLNSYRDDLSNIFKLFLDTSYDESDDFLILYMKYNLIRVMISMMKILKIIFFILKKTYA